MSRALWTDLYRATPVAIAVSGFLVVLTLVTTLMGAFSVSWLVDSGQNRDIRGMYYALSIFGASFTTSFLISAARGWLKDQIHQKSVTALIKRITDHESQTPPTPADTNQTTPYSPLLDKTLSDEYYYQLASAFEAVYTRSRGFAGAIAVATVSPVMAVAVAVAMFVHSRSSTNFLRESMASYAGETTPSKRRAEYLRKLSLANNTLGEIHTLGISAFLGKQFKLANAQKRAESAAQHHVLLRPVCVSGAIALAVLAGAWAFVGWQAWHDAITLAGFALVLQGTTIMRDLGPLGDTAVHAHKAHTFHADVKSQTTPTQQPGEPAEQVENTSGDVELNDVRVSYPSQPKPALAIKYLRIDAGQHVAIVGANGAGKSTLMNLIAEQHCPIAEQHCPIVAFQHPTRYPTTAQNQLTVGNSVDTAVAVQQLGLAAVMDELPDQEDTFLGTPATAGTSLSGGQWQRLGVGRALAHLQPGGLLLLDEPSSALSPTAEAELFAKTLPTLVGNTVIVATHFLPNVKDLDRVIVLDEGQIVEDGTHQELMAAGGTYHDMFVTQAATFGAGT